MEKDKLMNLSYDAEADVLYLSIGEPRPAISREIGEDILLRLDPTTGAVVGLTIFNLAAHRDLSALPLQIDLRELAS
ncbi:MAG: DUF2283 domain-containing protein [Chloroflexi bacterium]|nr:DUF2283 domain-containing protein [Chloroflexota bacterium]